MSAFTDDDVTGRTLYPCCQCCRPADHSEDCHTVPCLKCGQKPFGGRGK